MILILLLSGPAACGDDHGPSPTTGAIYLLVSPSASPFDPDGFSVSLDGGADRALPEFGDFYLEDLAPGVHQVALTGLDRRCMVTSENPQSITVVAGDTVFAYFSTFCDNTGLIAIATTTTGQDLDPDGYHISLDGTTDLPVEADATLTFASVEEGDHEVTLLGIAPNCAVQGAPATRAVTVVARDTAEVAFEVACTAIP
jgi:hypothetical protein